MSPEPRLPEAIAVALNALRDFSPLPSPQVAHDIERALREALTAHQRRLDLARGHRATGGATGGAMGAATTAPPLPADLAGAAVRAACAHLATRSFEDAYLALRTAGDHFSHLRG